MAVASFAGPLVGGGSRDDQYRRCHWLLSGCTLIVAAAGADPVGWQTAFPQVRGLAFVT